MKKVILVLLLCMVASPAFAFDLSGYTGPISYHFTGWGVGREYTTNDGGATWIAEDTLNNWFSSADPQGLPAGDAADMVNAVYTVGDGLEDSWGIIRLDQGLIQTGQPGGGTEVWSRPVSGAGEYVVGIFYGFDDVAVINGAVVDHTGGTMELYALNLASVPDGTGLDPDSRAGNAYPGFTGTGAQLLAKFSAVPLNANPTYSTLPNSVTRRDYTTGGSSIFPFTYSGTGAMLLDVVPGQGTAWQVFDGNGIYDNFGSLFIPGHDMLVEFTYEYIPGQSSPLIRFDSAISDPARGTAGIIPEPASMVLLGIGLVGLARLRRRKG